MRARVPRFSAFKLSAIARGRLGRDRLGSLESSDQHAELDQHLEPDRRTPDYRVDVDPRAIWDGTMKLTVLPRLQIVSIGLFLAAACSMVGVAKPGQVSDEVIAVCRAQEQAWNRGDLDGFMSAGYWHSDKLTFFSGGSISRGYDAMLARYKSRYQGEGKEMGRLTFSDLDPIPLDNEHAVVRGRWRLTFEKEPPMTGLFTLIFAHTSEGWRIVHDHTSLDTSPPSAPAG
jgi:ketosteroid isomerase-like protein